MNDFKTKEGRRQERERQLEIMRSVVVEFDPSSPGGLNGGGGANASFISRGSRGSTSHSSGSQGSGGQRSPRKSPGSADGGASRSNWGTRRSSTDSTASRPRRSRSADMSAKIMRDAGMPVSGVAVGTDMMPRRRSGDVSRAIADSVASSGLGTSLDALEKDIAMEQFNRSIMSEKSGAGGSASKDRPPRGAVESARQFLWDDDLPNVELDPMSPAPSADSFGGSASSWRRARDDIAYGIDGGMSDFGHAAKSRLDNKRRMEAPSGVGAHHIDQAAPGLEKGQDIKQFRRSLFDMGKPVRGLGASLFGGGKKQSDKGLVEVDFNANLAPCSTTADVMNVADNLYYDSPAAHIGSLGHKGGSNDPYAPKDSLSERIIDGWADCLDSIYDIVDGCLRMDYAPRHIWKVLFLLAAVVVIIGASVTFGSRKMNSAGGGYDRGIPMVGSVGHITDKARYKSIKARISSDGISSSNDFKSDASAQSRALYWISETDGLGLKADDPYLLQRYALAVFYFQAADANIAAGDEEDEVDKRDQSLRHRQLQDNTLHDSDEVLSSTGWKAASGWMSKTGHCSWYGIQCHHQSVDTNTVYGGGTHYNGTNGITIFYMTNNHVRGEIPKEFAALKDMRALDLGQNKVKGSIPSELGSATELVTLYLNDNMLTGSIPATLGQLSKCTHMYLNKNQLSSSIPDEFSNLSKMRMMGLHRNALTGTLPDFTAMQNLRALYIDSNHISGPLPSSLGELKSLIDLRMGSNDITGTIPSELGKLTNLRDLHLQRNELRGTLPLSFAGLENLHELHLDKNRLSGSLPMQIGFLGFFSNLKVLYLDGNEITGTIPPSVANMENLVDLYLHDNKLEGPIPKEISRLGNLKNLRLNDNDLSSTIPNEFDNLIRLEYLYLHNNLLSGTVPNELGVLNKLFRFRLYGNEFHGNMPNDICLMRGLFLEELQADCEGNDPPFVCNCCTTCFR